MITGVIKNKVDKIWTDLWAGGITNPLTVIEQMTYLMFIRSLDEKELETEEFEHMTGEQMDKIFPSSAVGQSMRWSKFKNNDPRDIYDVISRLVFPAIKNMKHGHLPDFNDKGELVELTDETEEIVFAVHDTVAKANENDRTNTEIHEVLHDDVAGVLGPGKAALHHGKAALHEEDQHSANQKPNAQGNAFQFHCSIAPFSVLHTGGWCGTFRLICQSIPLFLSFRNDRSREMTCKNTPYFGGM